MTAPRAAAVLIAVASLGACAVGPDFKRPQAPPASGYGASQPQGPIAASGPGPGAEQRFVTDLDIPAQWWALFGSAKLNKLVEEALRANPNVAAAEAALRQANELHLAQRAALFPVVQAGIGVQRTRNPNDTLTNPTTSTSSIYNLYTAQLSLSYVPDVFGGIRRSAEAAGAQAEFTRYQRDAAYLTLSSNVVVAAIQEAGLRGAMAAVQRQLALQRELTETVRRQRSLGTASDLDLLSQQSAEAQTAQLLPPLVKQLGFTRDLLTALLGRLPSEEPEETFHLEDVTLPTELPLSLPSRLVEQRPDIRQAEANLHAASAEVGVAISARLPQFAITAAGGSTALTTGALFGSQTGFWGLGFSALQTLFDAGALQHRQRAAEAAFDQAAAQYRATVIVACQNVADSLRALQADAEALRASAEADRAAEAAYQLARRQYDLGSISLLAVMNAEIAFRQARTTLVQAQATRYADTAGLFQALGGGWTSAEGKASHE